MLHHCGCIPRVCGGATGCARDELRLGRGTPEGPRTAFMSPTRSMSGEITRPGRAGGPRSPGRRVAKWAMARARPRRRGGREPSTPSWPALGGAGPPLSRANLAPFSPAMFDDRAMCAGWCSPQRPLAASHRRLDAFPGPGDYRSRAELALSTLCAPSPASGAGTRLIADRFRFVSASPAGWHQLDYPDGKQERRCPPAS